MKKVRRGPSTRPILMHGCKTLEPEVDLSQLPAPLELSVDYAPLLPLRVIARDRFVRRGWFSLDHQAIAFFLRHNIRTIHAPRAIHTLSWPNMWSQSQRDMYAFLLKESRDCAEGKGAFNSISEDCQMRNASDAAVDEDCVSLYEDLDYPGPCGLRSFVSKATPADIDALHGRQIGYQSHDLSALRPPPSHM